MLILTIQKLAEIHSHHLEAHVSHVKAVRRFQNNRQPKLGSIQNPQIARLKLLLLHWCADWDNSPNRFSDPARNIPHHPTSCAWRWARTEASIKIYLIPSGLTGLPYCSRSCMSLYTTPHSHRLSISLNFHGECFSYNFSQHAHIQLHQPNYFYFPQHSWEYYLYSIIVYNYITIICNRSYAFVVFILIFKFQTTKSHKNNIMEPIPAATREISSSMQEGSAFDEVFSKKKKLWPNFLWVQCFWIG